jgi:hypothetical protein
MAIKLNSEGKLLLAIAAVTLLLASMTAVLSDKSKEQDLTLSTYSSRSGGARATFLFIHELGYAVERWSASPASLPEDPQNTLLIVMKPERPPSDDERIALNRFVTAGGTLLVSGAYDAKFVQELRERFEMASESWQSFSAEVPHPLNQEVTAITMPRGSYWEIGNDDLPLYGEGEKSVVVVVNRGKGRVLWLASPVPLSNAGLKGKGNPEFLANILFVGGSRRVLWDLYFSEDAPGKHSPYNSPALIAAGTQVLFVFSLVVWTHSRRSGPIRDFHSGPVPMSQMEFVETLGSLYESADATNVAVQIAYARFAFLVARRFGISASNVNKIGESVALATGETPRAVVDFITECDNIQHHGKLSNQEAIVRVQRLHAYLVTLKLSGQQSQETH